MQASLRITKAGKALVDDSCNGGSGQVTVDGDRIVWGERASTRMACVGQGTEEVQEAIREVLGGDTTYSIEEHSLTVTRGDRALTFRAESKQPGE